jgi:hypothetical protein
MTNQEKLDQVIKKAWPDITLGEWGRLGPNGTPGSPYSITTIADGGRRIQLRLPDGDVISGNGKNLGEAIDALAAKLERK